ncbi:MAG: O-antigen ligase family protein [Planctomycetota bacterium]|nr:O-antigen ligase family protein [Planctomycetota bacterium]
MSEAPALPAGGGSWFSFARMNVRGLPLVFWAFLLYLFLNTSYVDEEWAVVGALRLRPLSGLLVLAIILSQAALKALVPWRSRTAREDPSGPALLAAPGAWWLFLFLVAGFLSWVWAYDPSRSGTAQIEHAKQVLPFFAGGVLLTSRRRLMLAILVLCAGYGVYLLRSFTEFLSGKHDFTMGVKRMLGAGTSYEDPNSFAATVVFGLVLVVWAGIHTRSRALRLCSVVYLLLGSACVIFARSRSGLVLLVLALVWTFFSIPSRRIRAALAVAVIALGIALAGAQTEAAMERFAGIFSAETYERDASTRGRIEGYVVSWQIFQQKPVFGVGQGNWGHYRARHIDGNKHEPHTLGGQLIATRGLAGGVTFLGFLLVSAAFALRVRRERRGTESAWARSVAGLASVVLATHVLLLVSGLAAHNLDRPQWYLLPALLAAAALSGERRAPDAPPARDRAAGTASAGT